MCLISKNTAGGRNAIQNSAECVVLSPFSWGYEKHHGLFFDKEVNSLEYLSTIKKCSLLNMSPECFGSYKGPVVTDVVFGM